MYRVQLEWKNPDVEGLVQFLVAEKGFKYDVSHSHSQFMLICFVHSEERVRKGAEKLQKALNSKQQGRLDGFFSVKPKEKTDSKKDTKGKADAKGKNTKRKVDFNIMVLEKLN